MMLRVARFLISMILALLLLRAVVVLIDFFEVLGGSEQLRYGTEVGGWAYQSRAHYLSYGVIGVLSGALAALGLMKKLSTGKKIALLLVSLLLVILPLAI